MKTPQLLACTAIALVMASPTFAAKTTTAAHAAALKQPLAKVSTALIATPAPIVGGPLPISPPKVKLGAASLVTKTGSVDSTTNGVGTYKEAIVTNSNGTITEKTTDTYKNGAVTTTIDTTTKEVKGESQQTVENISAKGVTVTDDTIYYHNNGTETMAGNIITAKGQLETFEGTETKTASGYTLDENIFNSAGAREVLNRTILQSKDAWADVQTGTNFNGKAINFAILTTTGSSNTNSGTTTGNGAFTYSTNSSQSNGITTSETNRSYANGAASTSVQTSQSNANGSHTYDDASITTASNGTVSSKATSETFTKTATAGVDSVTGVFAQNNGDSGTIAGTDTTTSYGSVNNQTYTNQNGATKTVATQQLKVGDAILNINTGSTFAGQANNSIGLINVATAN